MRSLAVLWLLGHQMSWDETVAFCHFGAVMVGTMGHLLFCLGPFPLGRAECWFAYKRAWRVVKGPRCSALVQIVRIKLHSVSVTWCH